MQTTSFKRSAAITIFITGFLIFSVSAQDKGQSKDSDTTTFKAQTNLVLVPVVVTDKQGHHIAGLTASDFELKQEGKVQKIISLDEIIAEPSIIKLPTLPPNVFTNQVVTQKPKKLLIIALDLVNNPFAAQIQAKQELIQFLTKSGVP